MHAKTLRHKFLIASVVVTSVGIAAWLLSPQSDAISNRQDNASGVSVAASSGNAPASEKNAGDAQGAVPARGQATEAPSRQRPVASARAGATRVDFYRARMDSDRLETAINALGSRSDQLGARMTALAMAGELCLLGSARATSGDDPTQRADPASGPLPGSSPASERAKAALAILATRRVAYKCAGVDMGDREHVDRLWQMAANTGDPVAQAYVSWREAEKSFAPDPALIASGFPHPEKIRAPERWTDSVVESILRALATRDPAAIAVLGPLLQTTSHVDGLVLVDSGFALVELPHSAWTLIACEYGLRCDSTSTAVLAACANEGRCDVSSLEELVRRHLWTPSEAERFDRVRDALRALVESGKPSLIRTVPIDMTQPVRRRYASTPLRFVPPG